MKKLKSEGKEQKPRTLGLRATDPETARVVTIHKLGTSTIVGAGCLLNGSEVLTCRHVVRTAVEHLEVTRGKKVSVQLVGITSRPVLSARVSRVSALAGPGEDLVTLELEDRDLPNRFEIPPAEFATPLRHGDKSFSVLGFPNGDSQGCNASGRLHGSDALGLIQMDMTSSLMVESGYSGAPVWSSDLGAFVGIVVSEASDRKVAWCIPSRILSEFLPQLIVKFRIPPSDRPIIHDYVNDDPNLSMFGMISATDERSLEVTSIKRDDDSFRVDLKYKCIKPNPHGKFVTFITHPSLTSEEEDPYELFSPIDDQTMTAENYFWADESFTVAAIGDGGNTVLTYDLATYPRKPKGFE
jgi:hypothetical protein